MGQDGTDRTDATNEWDRTKRMVQDCRKVTGPTGQDRTTGKRQDHQNWMGPTGQNGINGLELTDGLKFKTLAVQGVTH